MRLRDLIWTTLLPLALILPAGCRSGGPCLVTETAGPHVLHDPGWAKEGEGTILRLENDRVSVEVVPALAGNVIRYVDKSRPADRQPFSRLDDAFANSGVWKAGEYTCRIGDRGPDKASLTVVGTGTLTPFGTAAEPAPLATSLRVERTLTVRRGSSAVRIDVTVTNTGQQTCRDLRYMVHALYEYKMFPGATVYAYLPTDRGVRIFDHERIVKDMALARAARPGHPWRRWSPPDGGIDKPRHPALGWAAMSSDSGYSYLFYDPAQFDFVGLWNGTHPAEWLVIEPNTKGVDLAPGRSVRFWFALATDASDVPVKRAAAAVPTQADTYFAMPGNMSRLIDSPGAWATDPLPDAPVAGATATRPATQPTGDVYRNALAMELVKVPAGEFTMGAAESDPAADIDERPAHKVRITHDFYVGRHLVTNAQYRKFQPGQHSEVAIFHFRQKAQLDGDSQPALITDEWQKAKDFCDWLNKTDTARPAGYDYRLPTEAEWEYVAKAGRPVTYVWGSVWDGRRLNFGDLGQADGNVYTSPVGAFDQGHPFGIADLAGNVWEWCEDFYDPYFYEKSPTDDPVNAEPAKTGYNRLQKVVRGGSWGSLPAMCRTTARFALFGTHPPTMGFRVVLAARARP